ncbi:MAG: geranylgeranyl reductase family protein, partial [Candidatus Nanopelagicales bacterium]
MSLSDADVIVVGAGPSGSTTSYYLAQQGLKVLLLEKTKFPREKVCGDGLTPRSVKQLLDMGIEPTEANGWIKNKGLRIIAGKHRLELNWPELESFPNYGLVRTRHDFDEILAQRAKAAGADLREETRVLGPIRDEKTGRVIGVNAKTKQGNVSFHAPFVVAADGVSARMALALGLQRREDRPMGVAVRTYYKSPRTNDDFMESWLELWDGDKLLPGYGWIFGVGDGTSNVGLGILDSSPAFQSIDYKELLKKWLEQTPLEWGYRDENMVGEIRGAALPMGFNRQPFYTQGLVLVGDSGGMVNPFNGEGIAYAMESGKVAAEVIAEAAKANNEFAREKILHQYP